MKKLLTYLEKLLNFKDIEEEINSNYNSLKEKMRGDEKLIFFLGAGISKAYGLKNWNELADKLVEKMYFNNDKFNVMDTKVALRTFKT